MRKEMMPIRWYVNLSSLPESNDWVDALMYGQSYWNDLVGDNVFCRTMDRDLADVEVIGNSVPDMSRVALSRPGGRPYRKGYGEFCSSLELHHYFSVPNYTLILQVDGAHQRWTNDAVYTEPGADPSNWRPLYSRLYITAHEMGHILGLAHDGFRPEEPVPSPGITSWSVMGEKAVPDSNLDYFCSPIEWTVDPGQVDAINCSLYRIYP